jgi:hypothetical protein
MFTLPTYADLGPDPEPRGNRADLLIDPPVTRAQPIRSSPHNSRGFRPIPAKSRRHTVDA